MSFESWRISYQSSEQAARAAYVELERLRGRAADLQRALLLTTAALNVVVNGRALHLDMARAVIANAESLMEIPSEPANDVREPVVCPKCTVLREVMSGARDVEVNAHRAVSLARWGHGPDDIRGKDDPAAHYVRGLYAIHLIESPTRAEACNATEHGRMLALVAAAERAQNKGWCIEGDLCVCRGDTPSLQAECSSWKGPPRVDAEPAKGGA